MVKSEPAILFHQTRRDWLSCILQFTYAPGRACRGLEGR